MTERTRIVPQGRVVLCADDFGLSEGVSRAILELAEQRPHLGDERDDELPGLAPAPRPGSSAFDGRVGIGLHLNLTAGAPLGPMPASHPKACSRRSARLSRALCAARLPRREIAAEIERQLDAFEAAFGRGPDFVDGHQHVHVLPGLRGGALSSAASAGVCRLWLRDPRDDLGAILGRRHRGRKGPDRPKRSRSASASTPTAPASTPTRGFRATAPSSSRRMSRPCSRPPLRGLGRRPVVMCHPAHPGDELRAFDPVPSEPGRQSSAYLGLGRLRRAAGGARHRARPGLRSKRHPGRGSG